MHHVYYDLSVQRGQNLPVHFCKVRGMLERVNERLLTVSTCFKTRYVLLSVD